LLLQVLQLQLELTDAGSLAGLITEQQLGLQEQQQQVR
jgi:hypothetical protein